MEHVFPMIDLKATGRRIKELREQRGISVRQLQTFLGFEQPQAIYKWQRGECLPTFDNMYAMACFFHVKVDEILVGNRQDFDIINPSFSPQTTFTFLFTNLFNYAIYIFDNFF